MTDEFFEDFVLELSRSWPRLTFRVDQERTMRVVHVWRVALQGAVHTVFLDREEKMSLWFDLLRRACYAATQDPAPDHWMAL